MGDHASTSSNQASPTDSTSDLPPLEDLIREEWNSSRGKLREATTKKKPDRRRASNEDPRAGSGSSSSSTKRRNMDHRSSSSPNQGSGIKKTTGQDRRRSSASTDNNEASGSSGKGDASHHRSIPPLNNNIAAAIFVPITNGQALLSPPPAAVPDTPPYFLERLERLNAHEAAVRGNIEALYGLELLRVRAEVAAAYVDDDAAFDYFAAAAAVRPAYEGALRANLDEMIDSMRRPDPNSCCGNLKDVPLPNMCAVPITYHPVNSPREAAANDVLRLLGAAATELGSFDNHVRTISDGIKREMQGAAARGMREKQDRMDTD